MNYSGMTPGITNTHTYYLFYRKEDSHYNLYAYTDTKALAKRFKKERNMDLFLYEKRDLSQQDIHFITEEFPNGFLINKKVDTRVKDHPYEKTTYELLCTKEEYNTCMSVAMEMFTVTIFTHAWNDYRMFTEPVQHALDVIHYLDAYDYVDSGDTNHNDMSDWYFYVHEDFVSIFVHLFNEVLKLK